MIRNRYKQVPHLSKDTNWYSNKNTINITNKSQEVSPFPSGDHKAAMNRRESTTNTRQNSTNDPQQKYRLGKVSNISIHHECEGGIEKSVPRITDWYHEACRVMTNGDDEGRSFLSHPHTHDGYFFLLTTKYLISY